MSKLAIAALFAAVSSPTLAQGLARADPDSGGQAVDEVIVTGQKMDRTLQQTPTSVGVTTASDIQDRNLISVYDALQQTANIAVPTTRQTFSIRGIDAFNVSGAGDGALASVYLDGAALPRRAVQSGPLELFDIAQVEVYRGPQSTLQGRNALAGAIIIRTTDPSFQWSARARVQLTGEEQGRRVAAALGGPMVEDQLAFRVSGEIVRADGLIYGINIRDDYDPRRSETARAKLLFTPSGLPGLKIIAGYMHDRHLRGESYVEFDPPYSTDKRVILQDQPTREVVKTDMGTLNASYAIGPRLTLSSVSNYSKVGYDITFDQDFSPQPIGFIHNREPVETFTQEARLNVELGRLQGLVGGYYSDEDARDADSRGIQRIAFSTVGIDRQLVAPPPAGFGLPQATANLVMDLYPGRAVQIETNIATPRRTRNKAPFGDAAFAFAERFKLHAGFRWDNERQDRSVDQVVTLASVLPDPTSVPIPAIRPLVAGINAVVRGQVAAANNHEPASVAKYEAFLPKGGLTWQATPDMALSFIVQRGYRSGGSGTNSARARYFTFDPEYTWNYEAALRSEWFNRRLTLNANAFRIDWKDQQVRVNLTPGNSYDSETRNAGQARLWGFELEARARPTRALTLNAGLGYTRTRFISFTVDTGSELFVGTGNEFANAPRWTLNGGATWKADNGAFVNLNANYQSAAYLDALEQDERTVDARLLVNGRIGWQGRNLGVFLFATNLLGEDYVQSSFIAVGRRIGLVGDPRVLGVSLEGRF